MTGTRFWVALWLVAKTMALLLNIWCAITAMHHIGDQCMKEAPPLRNAENFIRGLKHFVEVQIIRMRSDPIYYNFHQIDTFFFQFPSTFQWDLGKLS